MSMGQTKEKQTKGKQKIEMKKIESYGDRMITFSKRKSGIYKKLNEIVTRCDTNVAFLVFSQAGKPYTFAYPSMEEMTNRLKNPLEHRTPVKEEDSTAPLIEAYKKQQIVDLMTKNVKIVEDLDIETEKKKILKELRKEVEFKKMWWNRSLEGLSVEDLERRRQAFTELYDSLCDMTISQFEKDGEGLSYGHG